jgi:cytosine/adenosine deaminase-related metal-dependent hydrolase
VNSHHHQGLTPFQLGSPAYPLELWLASSLGVRDVDFYLDTLYSAFEMVESGVTTVQHLHGWRPGPAAEWPALAERILSAYRDIGMRVSYSFAVCDQNLLVYGADRDIIRRLPPALAAALETILRALDVPLRDYIAFFEHLWRRWDGSADGRTRIQLAPANLHWCSDEALEVLGECAARYGVGLHMHLLESVYQKEYARRRTGTTAIRHLHDLGLLGPQLTLGHGVWLTEEDIDLVAQSGTRLCHNASSNLRLRSGIAPLNHFTARGVPVALGIDEAGINDDRDMLQEMRLVLALHRTHGMGDDVPTAAQVFRMATEHGARTTGFAREIGTLDVGKAADLVVMDWRHLAYPYLDQEVPPIEALVQRGRPAGIKTVLVAGEAILRDGRFTRVDKAAALEELAATLRAPLRPDEQARRHLIRQVIPHVRRFYEGWLDRATIDPFYGLNSRR